MRVFIANYCLGKFALVLNKNFLIYICLTIIDKFVSWFVSISLKIRQMSSTKKHTNLIELLEME